MRCSRYLAAVLVALAGTAGARAETIRVAIGTQDTTINCATGGLLIREVDVPGAGYAELVGAGDLILPGGGDAGSGAGSIGWRVLEPARVAILDRRFVARNVATRRGFGAQRSARTETGLYGRSKRS